MNAERFSHVVMLLINVAFGAVATSFALSTASTGNWFVLGVSLAFVLIFGEYALDHVRWLVKEHDEPAT